MEMHKLLKRQLNKYASEDLKQNAAFQSFIEAVNESYKSFEQDKEIVNHAFETSEKEILKANKHLSKEYTLKKISIEKLKLSLSKIEEADLSSFDDDNKGLLNIVDYINLEISKRKTVENNLSRTLQLFTTLLSNLHSGILVEDEHRKILYTNQSFCNIFSVPLKPEEMNGIDCSESAAQSKHLFKDPDRFTSLISDLLREQIKATGIELELINGSILELDYIPIFIDNEYKGHLWEYSDITERKNYENNLLHITNVQDTILNGTNYSIIYTDVNGLIKSFNRGAEEMLGYKAEEVIDKYTPAFFHHDKEVEERAASLSEEQGRKIDVGFEVFIVNLKKGVVETKEWIYKTKNGKQLTVLLSLSVLTNSNDQIIGYLGIARDISEQKLAEKALKITEERYKNIIEKSTNIIYKTNLQGNFTFVNPVAERITGYTSAELCRMNYFDLIREDYRDKTYKFYSKQIKKETPSTYFEFPLITKEGKELWIGQSVQLTVNDFKETELVALAIDKSRQKQSEREIIETNQKLQLFQSLINNTSDAIQVTGENGQLFYLNNEASERLGIKNIDANKYNVCDFESMFKENGVWENHVDELKKQGVITIEGENINQLSGKKFPVEVTVKYIAINRIGYVIANSRDITIRKKTENLLKAQEEKYRNIIANMHLGLLEVDLNQNIQFVNHSFNLMSGFSNEELIGKKATEIFVHGENKEILENKNESRKKGLSDMYEIRMKSKRGEIKWWMVSGAPNYNDEGKLIGSIGIHLDITEKKKLEIELEKAKVKAEEASKAKEAFLANMSHEIRTPLNAINGMIRELNKENLTENQRNYVNNSFNASKHLLSIINNILDISKIEAGELNIEQEYFILKQSINNVVSMLNAKAEEKGIELKYSISNEVSEVMLGDTLRIEQILLNLIGNAIKFTEKGGIKVTCNLIKEFDDKQKIEILVSDTGIGMDKEYLSNIFSKFSQEDKSTSRKFGGTGLGMAITYELVHLMKGAIEVKSQKNQGTTFYVTLTLTKGNIELVKKHSDFTSLNDIVGTEILLVEDNEMNRLVAQNTLKYYGCKVTEAVNGIDAIEKLHFQKFDIILMDIQMPEMDGIEATKKIRSELKITTPIIALTANAFKSEIELCKSVGMNDYVTKPFEESILVNTISKHLGMESVLAEAQTFLEDASNNQPLYDLSNLIAISRGDTGFINKMISLFIEQAETTLMQIDTALLGENYSEISRLAHKIKPSIDNMGIISLKEKIRQLENDTKNSPDFNVINELVNEVSEILKNSIHQLLSRPV